MMHAGLEKVTPEQFEELAKELLCVDGFKNVVVHAKGADGGVDLTADKNIPIAHGREHSICWLVQCKHVSDDRALPGRVVEQILANFVTQTKYQGLIIITNAKLTATALDKIRDLVKVGHRPIFHWDSTDIEQFLHEHPFLVDKFDLGDGSQVISGASSVRTLFLSDGSVFAYHVYESLRKHGFNLQETRLHYFGSNALSVKPHDMWRHFDIVIAFLAELYWQPVPPSVVHGLGASIAKGLRAIFTPFCAWSVRSGVNPLLDDLLPVTAERREIDILRLLSPNPPNEIDSRLSSLKYSDTFIENQQVSFDAQQGAVFSTARRYAGPSTYEFLTSKPHTETLITDSLGVPVLVVGKHGGGRTAYFNMCAHNCLTPYAMRSPMEGNIELSALFAEFVLWMSKREQIVEQDCPANGSQPSCPG